MERAVADPELDDVFIDDITVPAADGYMPGKAGLGMDLPKDAFLQWVGWVMSPHYLFDDLPRSSPRSSR
jgi:hypothetical protein